MTVEPGQGLRPDRGQLKDAGIETKYDPMGDKKILVPVEKRHKAFIAPRLGQPPPERGRFRLRGDAQANHLLRHQPQAQGHDAHRPPERAVQDDHDPGAGRERKVVIRRGPSRRLGPTLRPRASVKVTTKRGKTFDQGVPTRSSRS